MPFSLRRVAGRRNPNQNFEGIFFCEDAKGEKESEGL